MKIKEFTSCNDFDILSHIGQGDRLRGIRKVNGEDKITTYTITYKPVYFKKSGCWALRCHHRGLNKYIKLDKNENLCEYIYIHPTTLMNYKFPKPLVAFFLRQKQLSQLTAKKEIVFTMKTKHNK